MSILKDKPNVNDNVKTILDKLASKQNVRVFSNELEFEKYVKQAEMAKGYQASDIGENDTYALMVNDIKMYRRFLILANVLKEKGLLGELSVGSGVIFSANDKVQAILEMLAEKISDPNMTDITFEKEAILATDIDERTHLDRALDYDRNGIRDAEEDINDNGVKDIDELIRKGEKEMNEEIQKLNSTEEGRREQQRIAREYAKDREKEEKLHRRSFLSNVLDD